MSNPSPTLGSIFQALSDVTRREVIQRLGSGPASTKELAEPFDMALPSFMQHLTVLENCGLIASKKGGRIRTWVIQREALEAAASWMREQRALWEAQADRMAGYAESLYESELAMAETKHDFLVSRYIGAPRRLVWKAWTIPMHLEQWWCPAPMTCRVSGLDVYPSGGFHLLMRDPQGHEMPQTGSFLEVIAETRIVFTTALTDEWRPAASPLAITAYITMADEGNGTRYETRVLYKDEEARRQLGDMQFEAGWSLATDQLSTYVSQLA
jgi:uncharacterized protein YndB with AHSA1/START domain/DNA-binding transcriptional ArsR family regulator